MKTWADALQRLRAELEQWFIKQCKYEWKRYYLYYLETTPEHDGGFLFLECAPLNSDYELGWNQPIRTDCTIDQNMKIFSEVLRKLPVLRGED